MKTNPPESMDSVHSTNAAAHAEIQRKLDEDAGGREEHVSQLQRAINASPRMAAQRKHLEGLIGGAVQKKKLEEEEPVQKVQNKTGMPDNLKSGLESLSGQSMDDVRVHYNSSKPASVQAHAYAQGSDIHLASGQEKHLAHEAWHTVQQKQGRVQPTTEVGGVPVNDNAGLEKEADLMGAKAMQHKS